MPVAHGDWIPTCAPAQPSGESPERVQPSLARVEGDVPLLYRIARRGNLEPPPGGLGALPDTPRAKPSSHPKPMKVWRERYIEAPPDAIWKLIAPVESIPLWMSDVDTAERVSGPAEGAGRMQRVTRPIRSLYLETEQEVVAWDPGRRMTLVHRRETYGGRETGGVRDFTMDVTLTGDQSGSVVRLEYRWKARLGMPWLQSALFGGRVMGSELMGTMNKIKALATEGPPPQPAE